jgi:hypothetical protein
MVSPWGMGGMGGGGFFRSMLGGLFGAAAGMWIYDQFLGGHSHASGFEGDSHPGGTAGEMDAETPYSGKDSDYSGGGGDFGGGGGDSGGDYGGGGGFGDSSGGDFGND